MVRKKDLYGKAQELDIPGRSSMSKVELEAAVAEVEAKVEACEVCSTKLKAEEVERGYTQCPRCFRAQGVVQMLELGLDDLQPTVDGARDFIRDQAERKSNKGLNFDEAWYLHSLALEACREQPLPVTKALTLAVAAKDAASEVVVSHVLPTAYQMVEEVEENELQGPLHTLLREVEEKYGKGYNYSAFATIFHSKNDEPGLWRRVQAARKEPEALQTLDFLDRLDREVRPSLEDFASEAKALKEAGGEIPSEVEDFLESVLKALSEVPRLRERAKRALETFNTWEAGELAQEAIDMLKSLTSKVKVHQITLWAASPERLPSFVSAASEQNSKAIGNRARVTSGREQGKERSRNRGRPPQKKFRGDRGAEKRGFIEKELREPLV